MEFLEINVINKGSITKEYRFQSLEEWWFLAKWSTNKKSDIYEESKFGVNIESYSLIQMKCK